MSIQLTTPTESSERSLFRSLDWFTVAFLGFIWVAFVLWANAYQLSHHQAAEQELDRQRGIVVEDTESVLKLANFFLAGADLWMTENQHKDPRSNPAFLDYVEAFESINKQSMVVRLVENDGTLHIIQKNRPEKQANVADRDYFKAAMNNAPGELFISTPFQGRVTGRWQIGLATRLSRPTHGVSVIFVAIEISLFDEIFKNVRLPDGGLISVLRRDGILLARSANSSIPLGLDLSNSPLFKQGLSHSESGFVTTDSPLTDKTARRLAYTVLPDYPVVINVGMSLAQLRQTMLPTMLLVGGFLALLSIFTLLYRSRIRVLLKELAHSRALLAEMAMLDQLTEIRNRRCFLEACDESIKRATRYQEALSMILLDIDHFKRINDTFGHPAGDFVLRLLVQTCQECLRNVDILGRLGGEEFGILLPNTGSEGASELARRIRERVENVDFVWDDKPLHLTVSLGVTQLHKKDTEFADLYGRVDKALYEAKEAGRNQVRVLNR